MLPFLKKKEASGSSGLLIKTRTPDEKPEVEEDQDDSSAAIESCAAELIRAVHARDTKAVASAMQDAFEILESIPHEENQESVEPHSYDAQNMKAGE